MVYSLKPGVSFCRVCNRIVFLDLAADRYFCLSSAAESSFGRLVSQNPLEQGDVAILATLARDGPLSPANSGALPLPCAPVAQVSVSLLDGSLAPFSLPQLMLAAHRLALTPVRLKLFGLAAVIRRLKSRKARVQSEPKQEARLAAVATAFRRLRYVATDHDKCLPRSIALTERLLSLNIPCNLVIAVKLQPFAAHAWVQSNESLINDRIDVVRDFTPILVV